MASPTIRLSLSHIPYPSPFHPVKVLRGNREVQEPVYPPASLLAGQFRARARGSSETPRHFALHCLTCALTIRAPGINLIFYFGNERSVSYDGGLLESACARLTLSFRRAFLMNLRELSSFSFPPSVCSFSPLHVSCSSCSGEHAYSLRSAETSSSLRDSPSFDP